MPPKRGERGKGSRGEHSPAPHPAARPPGGARFAPSASYIASHSTAPPTPPVQPVTYSGYAVPPAQPGAHSHVVEGQQPVVPQHPPAFVHRPSHQPPPAGYTGHAGAQPGPVTYPGRGPGPAYVPAPAAPPKAAWPPPQPTYERQACSRTPSVPPVDLAPSQPTLPPSHAPSYPAPAPSSTYRPSPPPSAPSAQSSGPPSVPPAAPTRFQHLSASAIPSTLPALAVPPPFAPAPSSQSKPTVAWPAPPALAAPAPLTPAPAGARAPTLPVPRRPAVGQAATPSQQAVTAESAPAATAVDSSSSGSDSSDSSSSSEDDSDESDSDDDDEVAGALVGERPSSRLVEQEQSGEAKDVGSEEAAAEEASDSQSDTTSDSESEQEEAHAEGDDENAVSDLEEAVQEQVDEDDDHGQDETLPFDLGSADEADELDDDEEDGEVVDDSLEHVAANARRKRRRLDSVSRASAVGDDDAMSDISRVTSRAVSVDSSHVHDLTHSPTRLAPLPPQVSDQALAEATPFRPPADFSPSTSTPSRPMPARDSAAPASPSADPNLLILPRKRRGDDDDDIEEGELVSDDDAASSTAPAYPPFHAFAGAASLASRAPFDRAASAPYDHAADASMDMDMSFADLPADLLADPSRRAAGAVSIPISSRASSAAPSAASGPAFEMGKAFYVGKASYERRKASATPADLPGGAPVPPKSSVPRPAASKLSYKPSPLSKPADPSGAAPAAAPVKAVYVRRQDASNTLTPGTSSAPATASSNAVAAAGQLKAVYERPAGAIVTAAPARATKNKKTKARGVMPFTKDEKRERLPVKIFSAFGDFATLESASGPAIFNVPHHTVLPAKNLPPPTEAAQHGFWPGPPNRKEALKKAIFPAPPEPLEDVDDDRPRVEVFIDNSNVLYSFLNWVRARPEAKITSTKIGAQKGKDGKLQPAKTLKTVTIAGKKVKLDYKMLFALLERGRRVERRVLVGSSTLWQSLEPAVEWGYEISLLQRVPRAEASTSASHTVAVAAQAAQQQQGGKKRKQGNKKAPPQPPVPQPEAAQTKHYKEQAVDELVHLKILESLLDFEPSPMPPPSPTPAPAVLAPVVGPAPVVLEPAAATEAMAVDPPPVLAASSVPQASRFEGAAPAESSALYTDRSTAEATSGMANAVNSPPPAESAEHTAEGPSESVAAAAADDAATSSWGVAEPAKEDEDGDASMAETQACDNGPQVNNAGTTDSAAAVAAPTDTPPFVPLTAAPSPAPAHTTSTSATNEAVVVTPRFLPSSTYLTGSQPTKPTPSATAPLQHQFVPAQPKITPAPPKITPAPPKTAPAATKIVPAAPKPPAVVQFVPRRPPRDRPVLVIVTGDANSSEYNPGGFLGCVRRALDRGWDVEIAAFTHGISSLWTGEQMRRTTSDGRRRGELRVIDLAIFAEELVSV